MGAAKSVALVAALVLASISFLHPSALAGPIRDAAKAGDAEEVERLIASGADIDEKDIAQKSAFHWAADAGHTDVVQVLVAKGASINAGDFTDVTALHMAAIEDHAGIVELLIAKGADVNVTDSDGITALDDGIRLSHAGIVEMLKRAGAKCGTNDHYSRWCNESKGRNDPTAPREVNASRAETGFGRPFLAQFREDEGIVNIEPPYENPCDHRTPSRPVMAMSGSSAMFSPTSAVGQKADVGAAKIHQAHHRGVANQISLLISYESPPNCPTATHHGY